MTVLRPAGPHPLPRTSPGSAAQNTDPKPVRRVVNPLSDPLDWTPVDENTCAFTGTFTTVWQRHHVVPRSQGGDDVSENLVWVSMEAHNRIHAGDPDVCARLVRYCRETVPELGVYADGRRWPGWLEDRYA